MTFNAFNAGHLYQPTIALSDRVKIERRERDS